MRPTTCPTCGATLENRPALAHLYQPQRERLYCPACDWYVFWLVLGHWAHTPRPADMGPQHRYDMELLRARAYSLPRMHETAGCPGIAIPTV
jgi:hypothetical protein